MKLVFTSYVSVPEYSDPQSWLKRIEGYTGILESLGKIHTVVSIERIKYQGAVSQGNVHYIFLKIKRPVIHFPWKMHQLIKKEKPDVVFVNGLIFPLQVIQLRLTLGKKVKIVGIHHAEKPAKGIKKYFQLLADKCIDDYMFAALEFGTEWKQKGNIKSSNKINEVMEASSFFYPVDKDAAKQQLSINSPVVFVWVGRLDANKDPVTVIKAFLQFQQQHTNTVLYMIYQNEILLDEIRQLLLEATNGKDAVQLVGKVQHDQLQQWYNAADFIISGSHYEGSGIAVCEAMSCGCIPVLTNIISFRAMTDFGKCGFLFEPGNTGSLLEALLQTIAINKTEERKKVLLKFKNDLSFEAIAARINTIISKT